MEKGQAVLRMEECTCSLTKHSYLVDLDCLVGSRPPTGVHEGGKRKNVCITHSQIVFKMKKCIVIRVLCRDSYLSGPDYLVHLVGSRSPHRRS